MRKLFILLLAAVPVLLSSSCGDNEKQKRIDAMYYDIKNLNSQKRDAQDCLDTWSDADLNRIAEDVSALAGYPITYRQNFQMIINSCDERIANFYVEIERLKDE